MAVANAVAVFKQHYAFLTFAFMSYTLSSAAVFGLPISGI